jgi:hypothetical protein
LKDIYDVDYFLIFPDMKFIQIWDLLIAFLVVASCIQTPWRLAYVDSDDSFYWIIADTLVDMFFL